MSEVETLGFIFSTIETLYEAVRAGSAAQKLNGLRFEALQRTFGFFAEVDEDNRFGRALSIVLVQVVSTLLLVVTGSTKMLATKCGLSEKQLELALKRDASTTMYALLSLMPFAGHEECKKEFWSATYAGDAVVDAMTLLLAQLIIQSVHLQYLRDLNSAKQAGNPVVAELVPFGFKDALKLSKETTLEKLVAEISQALRKIAETSPNIVARPNLKTMGISKLLSVLNRSLGAPEDWTIRGLRNRSPTFYQQIINLCEPSIQKSEVAIQLDEDVAPMLVNSCVFQMRSFVVQDQDVA